MKTEDEIRKKLELLFGRRLKARMKFRLSRNYHNCKHVACSGRFHVCVLNSGEDVALCDDSRCASCGRYECAYDADKVRDEFSRIIESPELCFQHEPKLAILIWVLQGDYHEPRRVSFFTRLIKILNPISWFRRNS